MRRTLSVLSLVASSVAGAGLVPRCASAQDDRTSREPVVRAILFYSPTCPHCRELVEVKLPPILSRYGTGFEVVGVNVLTEGGASIYRAVIAHHSIPEWRQGVPTVLVGSRVLVGGEEIPAELPGIIEAGLASSGVDWPDVAGIRDELVAQGLIARPPAAVTAPVPAAQSGGAARGDTARADPVADTMGKRDGIARPDTAAQREAPRGAPGSGAIAGVTRADAVPDSGLGERAVAAESDSGAAAVEGGTRPREPNGSIRLATFEDARDGATLGMADRFRLDPAGNALAVVVLLAMAAAMTLVARALASRRFLLPEAPAWAVPALTVTGVLVAAYLAWIEVTGAEAVCGPVGHCNAVQRSEYARLFGVLPVGLLGVAGYAAILAGWAIALRGGARARSAAVRLTWAMAAVATLFSAWLTFLEPFVIGASCAWCLSSAVIATLLLLAATPALQRELRARRARSPS